MSQPAPILDYASPRPRGKVRLPAKSVLRLTRDAASGETRVIESLEGKNEAIGALIFAGAVLVVMLVTMYPYAERMFRKHEAEPVVFILGTLWVIEASLMVAVINNTWRKTVLIARGESGLSLTFASMMRRMFYQWPAHRIGQIRVVVTVDGAYSNTTLGELRIIPKEAGEAPIHLFTDHDMRELERIAAALREALAGEPA
jgi:hypothetical protein